MTALSDGLIFFLEWAVTILLIVLAIAATLWARPLWQARDRMKPRARKWMPAVVRPDHTLSAARQKALERYRLPPGQCAYCDQHRNDPMMPSHTPSAACESGKRPHCTCDTCY